MANELKVTVSSTLTNGNLKEVFTPGAIQVDQATIGSHAPTVSVGTSEENLAVGDVSVLGWIFLRNLDTTNYVEWGASATTPTLATIGRLEAGEVAAFRMEPGVTLRWKADTATVKVKVLLLED